MAAKPKAVFYEDLEKQVRSVLAAQDQTKLRSQLAKEHPANIAGVMDLRSRIIREVEEIKKDVKLLRREISEMKSSTYRIKNIRQRSNKK
jgi:hypothetical protein